MFPFTCFGIQKHVVIRKGVEFFTNLFIQYDWHIKFTFTQICLMSIFWDAGSQGDTHRFKNSSAAYSAPLFGDFGGFMCVFFGGVVK